MSCRLTWFVTCAPLLSLSACGGSAPPAEAPKPSSEVAASQETAAAPHEEQKPVAAKPKVVPMSEREPESIVQLAFEPLAMGVRPGGKIVLAAHFRIAPGYRISWKASGEVGQA